MPRWLTSACLVLVASCQNQACPSTPGGSCDPRNANCPSGYACALSEVCTHPCEQASDCWIPVTDGCRYGAYLPGQRLPDGGMYVEMTEDGYCPDKDTLRCIDGYCQAVAFRGLACDADAGCDYDLYGPSEFKGNRDQGPVR
jgi:hypothetical protein